MDPELDSFEQFYKAYKPIYKIMNGGDFSRLHFYQKLVSMFEDPKKKEAVDCFEFAGRRNATISVPSEAFKKEKKVEGLLAIPYPRFAESDEIPAQSFLAEMKGLSDLDDEDDDHDEDKTAKKSKRKVQESAKQEEEDHEDAAITVSGKKPKKDVSETQRTVIEIYDDDEEENRARKQVVLGRKSLEEFKKYSKSKNVRLEIVKDLAYKTYLKQKKDNEKWEDERIQTKYMRRAVKAYFNNNNNNK